MSARTLAFAPSGLFDMLLKSVWVGAINLPALFATGLIVLVPVGVITAIASAVSTTAGVVVGFVALMIALLCYYAVATLLIAVSLSSSRVGVIQLIRHFRARTVLDLIGTSLMLTAIVLVGTIMLFIPGVYLSVRYMFATPVVVIEGLSYGKALARSSELTAGSWWRCFGALVLLQVFFYVVVVIVALVAGTSVIGVWAILIAEVLLMPCIYVFPIFLYFDARARKDGFVNLLPLAEGV